MLKTLPRESPATDRPSLGQNLKRLRNARGWNLNQLAAESGLPQSTLSKVENGRMSLNYDKLLHVATVLQVEVGELFASPRDVANRSLPMARRTIQRTTDADDHEFEHYLYRYLCTELKNRLMVPILLTVHPRDEADDSPDYKPGLTHIAGERFAYVLSGEVEFLSEQYENTILRQGDALYIDAAMPHEFVAPPGKTARILAIVTSHDQQYLGFIRRAASEGLADATQAYEAWLDESAASGS